MPTSPTYPGVYIEEVPSGVRTIVGVATSICAIIGRAPRGTVNEPTFITSFGDYERIFGGLANDTMGFVVRDFFVNGGSQAVILRLYHLETGKDSIYKFKVGTNVALQAASEGAWGANLRATIDFDISLDMLNRLGLAANDPKVFNLIVTDTSPGGAVEVFRNVTLIQNNARRIDRVLAAESKLVRWDKSVAVTDTLLTNADVAKKVLRDPLGELENTLRTVKDEQTQAVIGGLATPAVAQAIIAVAQKNLDDKGKEIREKLSDGLGLELSDFHPTDGEEKKEGLYALEKTDLFNLLCLTSVKDDDIYGKLLDGVSAYCTKRRAMFLVDPPATWKDANAAKKDFLDPNGFSLRSSNATIFFPRVVYPNPLKEGIPETFPACGVIAGNFAKTDATRGVWKAPAGTDTSLVGVQKLEVNLTDGENGILNPLGINCLRSFPSSGRVIWGSRTLRGGDSLADDYKYIPIRRLALYIEESLYRGTQWAVFEPNDEPLWAQLRLNIGVFMNDLFRQGAFQGRSSKEAYFVKCDKETTTQSDINKGIVNVVVGFAPLKPAEFVIIKLQQIAGQLEA
jgi:uncharacterized protein